MRACITCSSASLIVPFKPAAALCGCTVTIAFEDSPYCGQSGRVRRVFWRERTPWVLVRLRVGGIVSVPWDETDLPVTKLEGGPSPDDGPTVLLSSDALRDLGPLPPRSWQRAKMRKNI